jgi:anti-anti-sigma factor
VSTRHDRRVSLLLSVQTDGVLRTVSVSGDIDLGTRSAVHSACVAEESRDVVVDLHEAKFLDCSGYGALVAARRELEDRGGSLRWLAPTGQPARFLALLGTLEQTA